VTQARYGWLLCGLRAALGHNPVDFGVHYQPHRNERPYSRVGVNTRVQCFMSDAFLGAPLPDGLALAVRGDQCLAEQLLKVRPLAADDTSAANTVAGLVRDAGFDPVLVGPLSRAREFDVGTPVYNTNMSGPEVRQALGLSQVGTAS
jgi:hypothetical protein